MSGINYIGITLLHRYLDETSTGNYNKTVFIV